MMKKTDVTYSNMYDHLITIGNLRSEL